MANAADATKYELTADVKLFLRASKLASAGDRVRKPTMTAIQNRVKENSIGRRRCCRICVECALITMGWQCLLSSAEDNRCPCDDLNEISLLGASEFALKGWRCYFEQTNGESATNEVKVAELCKINWIYKSRERRGTSISSDR